MINRSEGFGFGLLPPLLRLPILFVLIVAIQFITTFNMALLSLAVSFALLILNFRLRYKKLFLITVSSTFLYLFIGNYLFSPHEFDGTKFLFFRFNLFGLKNGVLYGARRVAQLVVGFAWLESTNLSQIPEVFSVYFKFLSSFFKFFLSHFTSMKWKPDILRRYIFAAFSLFPRLLVNFRVAKWSLQIRAPVGHNRHFFSDFFIKSYLILSAIINQFFDIIGKLTFAGESHYNAANSLPSYDIVVRNMRVSYDENSEFVLTNVNLTIKQGEFVFIIGPNRSGKSTLLKALSGYIPRISGYCDGSFHIGAEDWLSPSKSLRDIFSIVRYVGQDPLDSIIGITVGQEIMGHTSNRDYAEACLTRMGLNNRWDSDILNLSGGQQVRLILASLLASNAKVIILDDPLIQLDEDGKKSFVEAFAFFIKGSDATVIMSDPNIGYFTPYITQVLEIAHAKVNAVNLKHLQDQHFFSKSIETVSGLEADTIPHLKKYNTGKLICSISDLEVCYDERSVVESFSLHVNSGELVAIMGPNGSGKTTAMLALANLIERRRGKIDLKGNIGFSFQNTNLQMLEKSVGNELKVAPMLKKWSESKTGSFIEFSLRWLGLSKDNEVGDLHPSDKRFLTLAAMNADVCLFILDEPNIEIQGEDMIKFFRKVESMLSKGIGIILITHDDGLARFCSRIIRMADGKIVAVEFLT